MASETTRQGTDVFRSRKGLNQNPTQESYRVVRGPLSFVRAAIWGYKFLQRTSRKLSLNEYRCYKRHARTQMTAAKEFLHEAGVSDFDGSVASMSRFGTILYGKWGVRLEVYDESLFPIFVHQCSNGTPLPLVCVKEKDSTNQVYYGPIMSMARAIGKIGQVFCHLCMSWVRRAEHRVVGGVCPGQKCSACDTQHSAHTHPRELPQSDATHLFCTHCNRDFYSVQCFDFH